MDDMTTASLVLALLAILAGALLGFGSIVLACWALRTVTMGLAAMLTGRVT